MSVVEVHEEMVDVVNESDTVVDQVLKSVAHTNGLLHRTVIGILRDSAGKFVLVRLHAHKQDAGLLTNSIGGHVQSGESVEDALSREIREEIGITRFSSKALGKFIFNREILGKKENHYFVVYEVYSDDTPAVSDEVSSFEYLTEGDLRRSVNLISPTLRAVLSHFYSYILS
jgi:isopentenyldiphosphate isomerase